MNKYYVDKGDILIGPVTMEKPLFSAWELLSPAVAAGKIIQQWEDHLASLPRYPIQGVNPWKDGEMVPESQFYLMDTDKWYWCKCEGCGWEGSSQLCKGGGSIADTDDYDDALCPECMSNDLDGDTNNRPEEYIGTVAIPIQPTPEGEKVEEDYRKSIEGNYVFDRNKWQATYAGDILLIHKK